MKDNKFLIALKGMIVGGTMLVPGVSGGSMAMLLGIYDRLVSSVSSFTKDIKKNILFLTIFALGGGIGILLFASPLLSLIEQHPMPTLYFFLGAVAGGVPLIFKQAAIRRFSWKIPFYMLLGLAAVLLFSILPAGNFYSGAESGILGIVLLLGAGFIAAIALVLPGISVSYLLLIMGLYDKTMGAISEFDLLFLLPLGIGVLLGIIATTKILEYAMTMHRQPTYLVVLGFVIGSVLELFPGLPTGPELILCMVTLAAGFGAIQLLSRNEKKMPQGF